MQTDIRERANLYAERPGIVRELFDRLHVCQQAGCDEKGRSEPAPSP